MPRKRISRGMKLILGAIAGILVFVGDNAASIFPPDDNAVTGIPIVHDGDTVRINNYRIRLEGIDAPELKQECRVHGKSQQCGIAARMALTSKINGQSVQCAITGKDRYKRSLGHCWQDGVNLNGWMVKNGYALAYGKYSSRYIPEEMQARLANVGIHNSVYTKPWDWRQQQRQNESID